MNARDRLFVALDRPDTAGALELVDRLRGRVGGYKIGLELFSSAGPAIVDELRERDATVFLDLKLHDIPNTVARAAAAATRLGAALFTVHATGGPEMVRRAVEAAEAAASASNQPVPLVLAVTVLTSHDDAELQRIGLQGPCAAAVLRLAASARDAGAGGVVCSPLEVEAVRELFSAGTLVVPGIRPASGVIPGDDQSRTATPARAVAQGADYLVIGRPITGAEDPAAAAQAIAREIEDDAGRRGAS